MSRALVPAGWWRLHRHRFYAARREAVIGKPASATTASGRSTERALIDMQEKTYCWSKDDESYRGGEESRLAAIEAALAEMTDELPAGDDTGLAEVDVWTAESVPISAGQLVDAWAAETLLDGIVDRAGDRTGEIAHDYNDVLAPHEGSLHTKLIATVDQWANEYGLQPKFWGVTKKRHHIVTVNAQSGSIVEVSSHED